MILPIYSIASLLLASLPHVHGQTDQSLESSEIRGIDPKLKHLYVADANGQWRCLLDPSIAIKFSQINDNTCRCPDGSDQPGTNACEFTEENPKYFYCENLGFKSLLIENFKLNDGVCDYDKCCDGSDEYVSGACPNVCDQVNVQYSKYMADQKKVLAEGLEAKKILLQKAESMKAQTQADLDRVRANKALKMEKLKALKKLAQDSKIQESSPDFSQILKSELQTQFKSIEEKVNSLKELATSQATRLKELESILQGVADNYNPNFNDHAVKLAIRSFGEYSSINQEDPTPLDLSNLFLLEFVKKLPFEMVTERIVAEPTNLIHHYYQQILGFFAKPMVNTEPNEPSQHNFDSTPEIQALERNIQGLQSEEEIYSRNLNDNYGPQGILRAVKGSWVNKKVDQYLYKIGFLDAIYQDNVLIGKFSKQEGNSMYFTGGTMCWNGPPRSAVLDFVCGPTNDLLSVSETQKCLYKFTISTPLGCEESTDEEISEGFKVDLLNLQGKL